jgi:hypothetical protein
MELLEYLLKTYPHWFYPTRYGTLGSELFAPRLAVRPRSLYSVLKQAVYDQEK